MMSPSTNQSIVELLTRCAITCEECFNGCLNEPDMQHMAGCIRADKTCSAVCMLTASLIASGSTYAAAYVDLCADVCAGCARECEKHQHDHCKKCAAICRECEEACENYILAKVHE
jgi:hypothetical protein